MQFLMYLSMREGGFEDGKGSEAGAEASVARKPN